MDNQKPEFSGQSDNDKVVFGQNCDGMKKKKLWLVLLEQERRRLMPTSLQGKLMPTSLQRSLVHT